MEKGLSQCSHSPSFWYDEGNIVLRIHDTLFRVHRGLLQTHSAIFQDAFKMPQPEGELLLEGCQVVPMMGDTVKDWENILTFMYQPLKLNPTIPDINTDKLCSLLRLARKYQFDDLFNSCIQRLQSELPMTLDVFDKVHPALQQNAGMRLGVGGTRLTGPAENLINIVNTALELEIECILPCAYYLILSRLPLENIASGVSSSSGTGQRVVLDIAAQEAVLRGLGSIFFDMLRSVERYTNPSAPLGVAKWEPWCGEDRQLSLQEEIFLRTMEDDDFNPEGFTIDWPNCEKAFGEIKSRVLFCLSARGREFVLARCAPDEEFGSIWRGLCDMCTKKEREFHDRMRNMFWDRLPAMFGIGRDRKDANGNSGGVAKSWKELTYYGGGT